MLFTDLVSQKISLDKSFKLGMSFNSRSNPDSNSRILSSFKQDIIGILKHFPAVNGKFLEVRNIVCNWLLCLRYQSNSLGVFNLPVFSSLLKCDSV